MSNIILIENLLKITIEYFNADRVLLADIHSNKFKDYDIYKKVFSVKHEYCKEDISSVKHLIQNKDISILEKEQEYYDHNGILIFSIEDAVEEKCVAHLKAINVKKIINKTITFKESILGILSIQFCDERKANLITSLSIDNVIFINSISKTLETYI